MLSRDDAEIVRRDAALHGLSLVLDPDAIRDWVNHRYPDANVTAAQTTYVRYKPGTSCLVAGTLDTAHGAIRFTMKAYRSADAALFKQSRHGASDLHGGGTCVGPVARVVLFVFPYDPALRALRKILADGGRRALRSVGIHIAHGATPHVLSYRPGRRFVARIVASASADGAPQSHVMRVYAPGEWRGVRARMIAAQRIPPDVACAAARAHPAFPLLTTRFIDGITASARLPDLERADVAAIVESLATLHGLSSNNLPAHMPEDEMRHLHSVCRGLVALSPEFKAPTRRIMSALCPRLSAATDAVYSHGDFAARQALLTGKGATLVDLDEACAASAAHDLGAFAADIDYREMCGEISTSRAQQLVDDVLESYERWRPLPHDVDAWRAAHLLRLAPQPFRSRQPDWRRHIGDLLSLIERRCDVRAIHSRPQAVDDPAMPWLAEAVDVDVVSEKFRTAFPAAIARVRKAQVTRHKPGRRCLIRYEIESPAGRRQCLFGKTRHRGLDLRTAALQERMQRMNFDESAPDGVMVPEVVGCVHSLQMWLQTAAPGVPATSLLNSAARTAVSARLADAIHALQQRGPSVDRVHTIDDELRILTERFQDTEQRRPELRERLVQLTAACVHAASEISTTPFVPSHRDFYPDQVLIDGARATVVDLDLYCMAHPALDYGNCLAHLHELELRIGPSASGIAAAFERRARALLHDAMHDSMRVWTTLSLARLVTIAENKSERQWTVEPLLLLCEQRSSVGVER